MCAAEAVLAADWRHSGGAAGSRLGGETEGSLPGAIGVRWRKARCCRSSAAHEVSSQKDGRAGAAAAG